MRSHLSFSLAALALVASGSAQAQLCNGVSIAKGRDGRALGHFAYGDAAPDALIAVPPSLATGTCRLRPEAAAALQRLLAAAAGDPAVQGRLYAFSCHRSLVRQQSTFCRTRESDSGVDRAISAAPPGHSEHGTGYAVDFTVRPADGCPDAEACMAAKPAFRWLTANAPRFGFELSFPPGNKQGVKWEPWHWRWVGTSSSEPGAARARFLFARARTAFPADPAIDPVMPRVVPPVVVRTIEPAATDDKGKKKRRRKERRRD
jgi:D-alanyl-D-alanine carboxypeptidase